MGAGNVLVDRDPRPLTRTIAARAAAIYAERFADRDGRIRATFDFVALSAWAPHESQPKPLKPGSASARLEDAVAAARRKTPPESGSWRRQASGHHCRPELGPSDPASTMRAGRAWKPISICR